MTYTLMMAGWQIVMKKSEATKQNKDQNNNKSKQTNKAKNTATTTITKQYRSQSGGNSVVIGI